MPTMNYLLPHAVDRHADLAPECEAVRCGGAALTYGELARRANGLARLLAAEGVGRGDRVGVFMTKSVDIAVALHGIMKAGGAYVPLDPFAPPARTAFVIRDCGIRHLVTTDARLDQSGLLDEEDHGLSCLVGSRPRRGLRVIDWDEVIGAAADTAPSLPLTEQDLAYILYTSGSTGTPKGMMHTHRSGLSFALWGAATYGLDASDRVSNHAPLHFDLSTFDFFAAEQAGATTVIVPEAITKLPADLARLMAREQIAVWYSVPFALIQLLERGSLASVDLSYLRWILFAGEVFPVKHLRRLMELLPHVGFSNLYGPAETNVCTYYNVPAPPPSTTDEPVPIGKACANVETIVVDDQDRAVAPGEVGELVIRGPVMMRGYWARPELNARAFFRRPVFGGLYEDVFYRSGDVVQELPDGNLKYIGRKDRQIKTRGYRVELDEVEAALLSCPAVEEAAAYAIPDGQGSTLIEAAVTPKDGLTVTADVVLAAAAGRLPGYAVPVTLHVLAAFPRTSTGKIDRLELVTRVSGQREVGQVASNLSR
jgi:amino acid adenylation domain-containing protein